jgi:hypothetical protein
MYGGALGLRFRAYHTIRRAGPAGFTGRNQPVPIGVIVVMKMYFDDLHDFARGAVPDFGLLRVDRHRVDPRAATSVVIACMTLAMAVMVTITLTEPVRRAPAKSAAQVAPPPATDKVTIVAAMPRLDVPCAEQTWPYIDRRCLTETTQKRPQPEGRRDATPVPADASKAVPAAATPPAAETQAGALEAPARVQTEARADEPPPVDTSEQAELVEDDDIPHPLPVLSERETRHLERMERRRAAQERRMRQPHLQLPIFGRIF